MRKRSVAVIGSFRRHNVSVQHVCTALRSAGFNVTSPRGSEILQEGVEFVRFQTDRPDWSDPAIQSLALHRIFAADLVYVVAPSGYVGNTTCYEIGRVVQRRQPIYFSAPPLDLPLLVPSSFVVEPAEIIQMLSAPAWEPAWLFDHDEDHCSILERELIQEALRDE